MTRYRWNYARGTTHGVAQSVKAGELAAAAIAGERDLPEWGAFGR